MNNQINDYGENERKIKKKMVMLTLKNNKPGIPLLLHDEPIYCDGKIVGRTTSGNYSFNFEKNMSFGYLNLVSPLEKLAKKIFFIDVFFCTINDLFV